ncbi:NADH dehydrogenase [ubiquinone] 1 alpha subcomplex subunit 3 isoform 1-T1 [Thomomys bottae]
MASRITAFLKDVWGKEPVLVVSFALGGLAIILPAISPYTKYSSRINAATPYNYPVPFLSAPPVSQYPYETMGICQMCPATLRSPKAPTWSG